MMQYIDYTPHINGDTLSCAFIYPEDYQADCPRALSSIMSEDLEDTLRKFLCELFALSPIELLYIQSEIQQKNLTEYAYSMESLAQSCQKFSRARAFQVKKRLKLSKMKKYSCFFNFTPNMHHTSCKKVNHG